MFWKKAKKIKALEDALERSREAYDNVYNNACKDRDLEWFQQIESATGFHPVSMTDARNGLMKRFKKVKSKL